ncbi:MAG: hypothetical protein E6R03_07875 [Hyphomicrobiaceae bacterium]|nr:MAG: hypothetical protein E6R03_07875 [Hyphomicrobiaceae bacterium]
MKTLQSIARSINSELASRSRMKIGAVIRHPDGRLVKVIEGCYLDATYGRVSNWWSWREVLECGGLGKIESGYGW